MRLTEFLPPVVSRAARRMLGNETRRSVYSSRADAVADCGGYGYETSDLVDVVFQKTVIYARQLHSGEVPVVSNSDLLALTGVGLAASEAGQRINVIDFGGACGAQYHLLRSIIQKRYVFNWHVVETPAMVNRAAERATDELRFYTSIEQAAEPLDRVDLVNSSGALQCVADPRGALSRLLDTRPRVVVLSRLGLTQGSNDLFTVHQARLSHNGPGPLPAGFQDGVTRYAYTFPVQTDIESLLTRRHRIILKASDPSGMYPVNREPVVGMSYVCEMPAESP